MGKGDTFKDKPFHYRDSYSRRETVRLTDYLGHSNHLYFTDLCWLRDGRYVLYSSDLSGYANIYMVEVGDVTDLLSLTDVSSPRHT